MRALYGMACRCRDLVVCLMNGWLFGRVRRDLSVHPIGGKLLVDRPLCTDRVLLARSPSGLASDLLLSRHVEHFDRVFRTEREEWVAVHQIERLVFIFYSEDAVTVEARCILGSRAVGVDDEPVGHWRAHVDQLVSDALKPFRPALV